MQSLNNLTPELAHAWHPVALSSEVTDRPLKVMLLGQPWVLARTGQGLLALRDVCPHRHAPLSAGCVVDGRIECPYHGWRFGADGRCAGIPAMGDAPPPRSAAAQAPAGLSERYGLVWLAPETPKAPLIEIPEWTAAGFRAGLMPPVRTRASAAQIVDNFLDVTHFFYLHGKTFGLDAPDPIAFYEVDRHRHEVVLHHRTLFSNGSGPLMTRVAHYHCTLPYQCRLLAEFPGSERRDMIGLVAQPEGAGSTRIYKLLAYNWADERQLEEMIEFETRVILEDVEMAEKLPSPELPLAVSAQAHARGDEIGIAWRHALKGVFGAPATVAPEAGLPPAPERPSPPPDMPGETTLLLLWASQTGQAEALAVELRTRLRQSGIAAQCQSMEQWAPERLAGLSRAVFITSTFGDGAAPDNGQDFWRRLADPGMPGLERLDYAVLGLGDRAFDTFCAHAQRLDERLRALGARPLLARAGVEIGEREAIDGWVSALARAWRGDAGPAAVADGAEAAAPLRPLVPDDEAPVIGRLLERQRLGDPAHGRALLHCVVDLAGTGLRYQTGDLLKVLPHNAAAEVDALLRETALDGEAPVAIAAGRMRLRDALSHHLDIRRGGARASRERARGEGAQAFAERLAALQPRRYSIASSASADPQRAHLLVSWKAADNGLCSGYLANAGEREPVRITVQPNPRFRLPHDERPIIMIGAGSGLAPFRGFLHERRSRGARGRNWLFFGERHEATDYHFRDELERLRRDGYLARIGTAFSRDPATPAYVQQRLLEQAGEVWDWVQQGAVVYLCGSARGLARGVDEALQRIAMHAGGLGAEDAAGYWAQKRREGHYLKDVY